VGHLRYPHRRLRVLVFQACQSAGITFIGGLTASVIFQDQMSAADFADEVGRDATDQPVPHPEIVPLAFRGALASPGFRQRLIDIAELQIDGGVDGIFFDEVVSSYIGASYDGDEGFDDHNVADFGRFLCAKHAGDPATLAGFDFTVRRRLRLRVRRSGRRLRLPRLPGTARRRDRAAGRRQPAGGEWGTVVQNRSDPSKGTFVQIFPALVYWQEIVLAVRQYARQSTARKSSSRATAFSPSSTFSRSGSSTTTADGPAPLGFNYVPTTGTAPDLHLDGTASYLPVLASLKAQSKQLVESVGGVEVPVLVFLGLADRQHQPLLRVAHRRAPGLHPDLSRRGLCVGRLVIAAARDHHRHQHRDGARDDGLLRDDARLLPRPRRPLPRCAQRNGHRGCIGRRRVGGRRRQPPGHPR
jgi:hypothetical protein